MSRILNEGLDYHDLVNQVEPIVTIDEYAAKMGDDDEIVTIAFTVKGDQASRDLVDWLERGYDWVLDAQVSDGEVKPGKYVVFAEMDRRSSVPERIVDILADLKTLTAFKLSDWTVKVDDEDYDADVDQLKAVMKLSPHAYREMKKIEEKGVNEIRELAGLEHKKIYEEPDSLLKDFISKAGL